jgi:ferrous iron transport protein A
MAEKENRLNNMVPCLLEAIKTFDMEKKRIKLEDLAKELSINLEETEKLVDLAAKEGFLESRESLKLTRKGEALVRVHRESYIHDRYAHGTGLFGRIARFLERKNRNMRFHWRSRHGLDDKAINGFYLSIETLKGRVEETVPLADLAEGERGVVSYMLGGYGMVRRLAEMGLTPGTTVKVLRRGLLRGPIQIEVRGSCLVLGHGIASRVFVKPLRK